MADILGSAPPATAACRETTPHAWRAARGEQLRSSCHLSISFSRLRFETPGSSLNSLIPTRFEDRLKPTIAPYGARRHRPHSVADIIKSATSVACRRCTATRVLTEANRCHAIQQAMRSRRSGSATTLDSAQRVTIASRARSSDVASVQSCDIFPPSRRRGAPGGPATTTRSSPTDIDFARADVFHRRSYGRI